MEEKEEIDKFIDTKINIFALQKERINDTIDYKIIDIKNDINDLKQNLFINENISLNKEKKKIRMNLIKHVFTSILTIASTYFIFNIFF